MSENMETAKRRLEFLMNERQQKLAEMQELVQAAKSTCTSSILHALTGDAQTSLLHLQQMKDRQDDINSQIRKLDFEIDTVRRELSPVQSTATRFTCPNCGVSRNISHSDPEFEKIKKARVGMCKTCGALFKANVDEKTDTLSFESQRENPTFYIHSLLLNTDLAYTEPIMPSNVRENLLMIAKQLEKSDETEAQAQLENIYSTYPVQASSILLFKGLYRLVVPLSVPCQRCGTSIPRVRMDNCPICKAAVVQKRTTEDPIQILKLRLAKGEISKEEYEDLKKHIEG